MTIMASKELILLDLDGTLIASNRGENAVPFDVIEVLPRRAEKLHELVLAKKTLGIVTNQGGVALGYQTRAAVEAKITAALIALGIYALSPAPTIYICLHHERAKEVRYKMRLDRRKPAPGMLLEAMCDHFNGLKLTAPPYYAPGREMKDKTAFIGDRETDEQAARAAGVDFMTARAFFGA
jgi:HAD superfamily hydrolase (TIGR01662 family)